VRPTLPGYRVVGSVRVARGIAVRSRSIVGNILGDYRSLVGGNVSIGTTLCEQARSETHWLMCAHAQKQGADAIIAMCYDATELMIGITEVLCY
jgi:uncharacterized protein YbjQ (UPF0145 family)